LQANYVYTLGAAGNRTSVVALRESKGRQSI
jgi:hypothetical protein